MTDRHKDQETKTDRENERHTGVERSKEQISYGNPVTCRLTLKSSCSWIVCLLIFKVKHDSQGDDIIQRLKRHSNKSTYCRILGN